MNLLREYMRALVEVSRPPDAVSARPDDVDKAKLAMEEIMASERSGTVWTFRELSHDVRKAMGRKHARAAIRPALDALIDEKKVGFEGGTTKAYYYIDPSDWAARGISYHETIT